MAISKEKKQELVQKYVDLLENSQAAMFLYLRHVGVNDVTQLRVKVREAGARYSVVKNTLFELALKQLDKPVPEFLNGPVSVVFCGEDIAAGAKAVEEFAGSVSDPGEFKVIGGLIEQDVLDAESALALTKLPSREMILSQLLATINAPASQLVSALTDGVRRVVNVLQAGSGRQLVNVLQARVSQLKEQDAA